MWDTIDTSDFEQPASVQGVRSYKPFLFVLGCAVGFWTAVIGGIVLATH